MTEADIISLMREAVWMTAKLSAPVLIVGMVVGLIVSIIQTTTSIQEQTLTFVPKLVAIGVATIVFLSWMIQTLSDYTIRLIQMISRI